MSGAPDSLVDFHTGAEIEATFVARARHAVVCKGARPDRVRFAALPRNFKGAVLVKELKAAAWD